MSNTAGRIAAIALIGALAVAGVASARPGSRSFARTYPIASRLCERAAHGSLPPRLRGERAQINRACSALETSYSQAVGVVLVAEQTYRSGVQNARVTANAACLQARQRHDRTACRQARTVQRQTVRSLKVTRRGAVRQYHVSIETSRRSFWGKIRSLRGGSKIRPDAPVNHAPVPSS